MAYFQVKCRDKQSGKPVTRTVSKNSIIDTPDKVRELIENEPGARNNTHKGFEVLDVQEIGDDGKPVLQPTSVVVSDQQP